MYWLGIAGAPATPDTGSVEVGRWAFVVLAMALLIVALAAMFFVSDKAIRFIIGVGAFFALIALVVRVVLLFAGTG